MIGLFYGAVFIVRWSEIQEKMASNVSETLDSYSVEAPFPQRQKDHTSLGELDYAAS